MPRIPTNGIDYSNKDYESFRSMMLRELQVRMPEYTDLSQSDAGVVILELLAQGLDILSYYQDIIANEAYLSTLEQRTNALKWCSILNYSPRSATPSYFKQVFVLTSPQVTPTVIPAGTVLKTEGSSIEEEIYFETINDLSIPAGMLGNEKDLANEYRYAVDIVQGTTVEGELLGTSDETPNQSFVLSYDPVILDSLAVSVNEGSGFEEWTRVFNFVESTATSKHFTASVRDNDEVTITFGNGIFGKIPDYYANGIACSYRIGGGKVGNVGANRINVLDSNIALVDYTFNPSIAFIMGQDKETLEEIKINAPVANRTAWGALTLEDFSSVIRSNFPEVIQAIAEKDATNPDNIHIFVLLEDNVPLTVATKERFLEIFAEDKGGRKAVGVDVITIDPPTFVPLTMEIALIVKDHYSRIWVENQIRTYITDYLAIGNYPFHKELSLSELVSDIMNPENAIAGIKSIRFVNPPNDVIVPEVNEILMLGSLVFETVGGVI